MDDPRAASPTDEERWDAALAAALAPTRAATTEPVQLGNYRLLRVLGSGGMGVVYEAEQRTPRRRVALKVLRSELADPAMLQRFAREGEFLGRLQHAGIARIYEAGTIDESGVSRPFLAMELIEGERLDDYLARRRPSLRARVELFLRMAEAVQHAHQKGVVHRDLKPSNVLVGEDEQPKVLDFGVARACDCPDLATLATRTGEVLGTLPYMSPEQIVGNNQAIDTRSDVYSLGVMLYEALAGRLPLDLSGRSLPYAARIVLEVEPPALSRIDPSLGDDLGIIVARALEKEPARRYGSAGELAEDLRRYLADEPIVARAPSASYQLRKFARRHRALVAGTIAVLVSLLVGLLATAFYALDARRSRDAAQRTIRVLEDILAAASPFTGSPDTKVVDVLDETARRLEVELARDPEVEAPARLAVAKSYRALGLYEQARPHVERACLLAEQVFGRDDVNTLRARAELADSRVDLGHSEEGEALAREIQPALERALGPNHRDALRARGTIVRALAAQRRRDEAIRACRELVARREAALGARDADTLMTMDFLASLLLQGGELVEAERVARSAYELAQEVHGRESGHTLMKGVTLAATWCELGRADDGLALFDQVLAEACRTFGPEHAITAMILASQAIAWTHAGQAARAETAYREALAIYEARLGPDHEATMVVRNRLGVCLRDAGRYDEAESVLIEVLEARELAVGPRHPDVAATLAHLGALYRRTGRPGDALDCLEQAVSIDFESLRPEDGDFLLHKSELAHLYEDSGRLEEAEALATEILPLLRTNQGADHPNVRAAEALLARLRSAADR